MMVTGENHSSDGTAEGEEEMDREGFSEKVAFKGSEGREEGYWDE